MRYMKQKKVFSRNLNFDLIANETKGKLTNIC